MIAGALAVMPPASAHPDAPSPVQGDGPATAVRAAAGAGQVLYSQNDHDAGDGIVSENFGKNFGKVDNPYDSRGADDFTVPSGSWTITEVDVTGLYRDQYKAASESVAFYADAGGLPGDAIARFPTVVGTGDGTGSFTIALGDGLDLPAGTYWVAVRVKEPKGFWVWETTSRLHGTGAAWRNPANGFGTGCRTFANMEDCAGPLGEGPDFMFLLQGTAQS